MDEINTIIIKIQLLYLFNILIKWKLKSNVHIQAMLIFVVSKKYHIMYILLT